MSIKSEKALENMVIQKVTTGRISKKKAMLDAWYSLTTATKSPLVLTNEKIAEVMSNKGIWVESILDYLAEDLKMKPQNRLGELKLAVELLGIGKEEGKAGKTAETALDLIRQVMDTNKKEVYVVEGEFEDKSEVTPNE